jgi:pimeloyl-ACP methyl ester carboxylesterase
MPRLVHLLLVVAIVASIAPLPGSATAAPAENCVRGSHPSTGALYLICTPADGRWNGDLVVFAHGYVQADGPLRIPDDQLTLPGGLYLPDVATKLRYAFATTSYRSNGLAVRWGVEDLRDLVALFEDEYGAARRVYLIGGSEGGINTTLAVERYPELFDGGLAACGPIGDFQRQINYWGDFRVLFDYFFPGVLPGDPVSVPGEVRENWESKYVPDIRAALAGNPAATEQLLRVSRAATDRGDPASREATVLTLLWYNVFATEDGIRKVGGQPFDNRHRRYSGSDDDARLNSNVRRYDGEPEALEEIATYYQTTGRLEVPLITLHSTGDPLVPYWHVPLYRWKAFWAGSAGRHSNIPAFRYGHCNFNIFEGLAAFGLLVLKTTGEELQGVEQVLPDAKSQQTFERVWNDFQRLDQSAMDDFSSVAPEE